jgi:hypothetical protein
MAIEASRRKGPGLSFRAWVIAKSFDKTGLGMVSAAALRAYAVDVLGMNPRTWQRWVKQALHNGYFVKLDKGTTRRRDTWYQLPAAGHISHAMGLQHVGRRVTVSAADIIAVTWKSHVQASLEHGKQISREKIQKTYNIPLRTQTYRAAQMGEGYKRTRNYSKSDYSADKIHVVRELSNHKAPFVSRGVIYWRLPDYREAASVLHTNKGRSRKINTFLRAGAENPKGLSNMRQALAADFRRGDVVRMFNLTEAQRKQSERRISRKDSRVSELYQFSHETRTRRGKPGTSRIWQHVPMG